MASVGIKELLEAGVHFGHQTRRWNPKMRRFIHGEREGIYLIDLLQTAELVERAQQFVSDIAHRGGTILFVGTKKQARDAVKDAAERASMPYVNHRWLGGLLTNYQTISKRIARLHDLERFQTDGQLELLPTRERMSSQADLAKLQANLGGVKDMQRVPDAMFVIDLNTEEIAVREGRRLRHSDHRPRRHQLRPRRHRVRDPGQRRRDPLVRADHERDRRRRRCGPRRVPRRGGAGARGGRGEGPARGGGARRARPRSRPREAEEAAARGGQRPQAAAARGRGGAAGPPGSPAGARGAPRGSRPPRPSRAARAEAPAAGPQRAAPRRARGAPPAGASPSAADAAERRREPSRASREERLDETSIGIQDVKALRDRTGAGMMDCKKALERGRGDIEKAVEILRVKGRRRRPSAASARRPRGRSQSYIHANGKVGVLVEVDCDTDFVARNEDFIDVRARRRAARRGGARRSRSAEDDVPEEAHERERAIFEQQAADKPENIRPKIAEGKLNKWLEDVVLLEQRHVNTDKHDGKTIEELREELSAKTGENVVIRRFARFAVGE